MAEVVSTVEVREVTMVQSTAARGAEVRDLVGGEAEVLKVVVVSMGQVAAEAAKVAVVGLVTAEGKPPLEATGEVAMVVAMRCSVEAMVEVAMAEEKGWRGWSHHCSGGGGRCPCPRH